VQRLSRAPRSRRAVATVELALLLPFLLVVLLGLWEVGRLIQVQQTLNNAAREGARVAAQGLTIKDSSTELVGATTGNVNVQDTIKNYLREAGIDTTGIQVTFTYLSGDTSLTQPYQAVKGQRFRVAVTLPFNNVRWTLLSLTNTSQMNASVEWRSVVDDPFNLDTNIPSW
jgi:Flp pilus assembly protein TadG